MQPSFHHATVQRLLGVTELTVLRDVEGRSMPAKVYPASDGVEEWVVEPPAADASTVDEPRMFTGRGALLRALEHAHRAHGSALYLSR